MSSRRGTGHKPQKNLNVGITLFALAVFVLIIFFLSALPSPHNFVGPSKWASSVTGNQVATSGWARITIIGSGGLIRHENPVNNSLNNILATNITFDLINLNANILNDTIEIYLDGVNVTTNFTSFFNTEKNFSFFLDPAADFVDSSTINVTIISNDTSGRFITDQFSFSIGNIGPHIFNENPANKSIEVPLNTTISFDLVDSSANISNDTFTFWINGVNYTSNVAFAENSRQNFTLTFDPLADFASGILVNVTINSSNEDGVTVIDIFTFNTIAAAVPTGGAGGGGGGGPGYPVPSPGLPASAKPSINWTISQPAVEPEPAAQPSKPSVPGVQYPRPISLLPISPLASIMLLIGLIGALIFGADIFGLFDPFTWIVDRTFAADDAAALKLINTGEIKKYKVLHVSRRFFKKHNDQVANIKQVPHNEEFEKQAKYISKRFKVHIDEARVLVFASHQKRSTIVISRAIPKDMKRYFKSIKFM